MIHKWRREFLKARNGVQSAAELDEALALKKRVRELEIENEI